MYEKEPRYRLPHLSVVINHQSRRFFKNNFLKVQSKNYVNVFFRLKRQEMLSVTILDVHVTFF